MTLRAVGIVIGILVVSGAVFASGASETGGATEVKTIRVSHTLAPESHYHQEILHWKELVKDRADGSIMIEVFHSAQLGSERDVVEGVSLGTIEATLTSTGPLPNFTNAFMVFDLPFIVQDRRKAYKWMDGPNGQEILAALEGSGIKGLGIWENGFRNLTNSERLVDRGMDIAEINVADWYAAVQPVYEQFADQVDQKMVRTSVGMITPPMAVNLFVAVGLVKKHNVTMEKIALRIVPFLLAEIVGVLLISNVPTISLGLLRLLRGGG